MAQTSRTFRIFVSSTFSDLVAERNALQARVFPRLRELAAARGCRFQVIDLRWGVSDEASLDQQAMNICLGEVARCQQTSPRPNFIVLLGDRYGWMPPPAQVPDAEFRQLLGAANGEDRAFVEEWYSLDENAVPPEWQLKPRQKGSPYERYDNWQPVEARLQRTLAAAAVRLGFAGGRLLAYTASATEQEIAAGALRVEEAPEHVVCFFRSIEGLPAQFDPAARDFLDQDEQKRTVVREAHDRQEALKQRLTEYLPGRNIYTYLARWTGSGITTDHIDQLCTDVYQSLERIILSEIERPHGVAAADKGAAHIRAEKVLDDEGRLHKEFAEERLRFFVGRTEVLEQIAAHLQGSGRRTLAIAGAGGTGKSALVAKAVELAQAAHPRAQIVYRFIGATPGSSDGRGLLDGLCREISRRYGASEDDVPLDYRDLVPDLGKRMGLAGADRPLILFLDSLDQLSASQGARGLTWLPAELPKHVSLVVTTREEERSLEKLQAKRAVELHLGGLLREEGKELLSQWLVSVHRTLQDAQREEVLAQFKQSEGNPLYLKLAFEEARLWASSQPREKLAVGVEGIIQGNMIGRLKHESNHGEMLVSRALGYLAASRYGLAEDELVDLLSRDLEVYAWFFRQTYHLPSDLVQRAVEHRRGAAGAAEPGEGKPARDEEAAALAWLDSLKRLEWKNGIPKAVVDLLKEVLPRADGPRLPIVLWSRLSFDLAPYLAERLVDGSSLLAFYHRELGDVSKKAFLAGDQARDLHGKLADYFRFKADPAGDGSWAGGNIHGLSELPFHLTKAGRHQEVYQTLTDFRFLEHKAEEVGIARREDKNGRVQITSDGVHRLQQDFERALESAPGGGAGGLKGTR
jgi:hypothetical protein